MIKMHDVLFGEFIEIEDANSILVVDCGCDNKRTFNSEKSIKFDKYASNCDNTYHHIKKNKEVMISHFHDDHVNGFKNFSNTQFIKVYKGRCFSNCTCNRNEIII